MKRINEMVLPTGESLVRVSGDKFRFLDNKGNAMLEGSAHYIWTVRLLQGRLGIRKEAYNA